MKVNLMKCHKCGAIDSYTKQFFLDANGNYMTEGDLDAFRTLHHDYAQVKRFDKVVLCGYCLMELKNKDFFDDLAKRNKAKTMVNSHTLQIQISNEEKMFLQEEAARSGIEVPTLIKKCIQEYMKHKVGN